MIISCINHKGGVAKTTTAYHIAAGAAARGVRPLLIDMDPQGNLTRMCSALRQGTPTIGDVLGGAHSATSTIRQAKQYISFDSMTGGHIVASNIGLENVAVGLMQRMFDKLTALKDALENEGRDQLVIIDTPPNAGVLTLNALVASTHTIVCADPEEDAISGIKTMIDIIARIPRERLDPPALLGVLATRVDAVSGRHADNLARLLSPNMPKLLGEIPKRNGRDADKQLALAYAPVVDQILAEAGLPPAVGVTNA
jgi:chromosome partitioning protein